MTIEEAHRELDKQYQKALAYKFAEAPVAWALYQAWKIADEKRRRAKK